MTYCDLYEGAVIGIYTEEGFRKFVSNGVCPKLEQLGMKSDFVEEGLSVRPSKILFDCPGIEVYDEFVYDFKELNFGLVQKIKQQNNTCEIFMDSRARCESASIIYDFIKERFEQENRRN